MALELKKEPGNSIIDKVFIELKLFDSNNGLL